MPQKQVKISPDDSNAFKHMFGPEHLKRLATALYQVHPPFNQKKLTTLSRELSTLEMKPRVQLIRKTLKAALPEKFPSALKILMQSVEAGNLKGFDLWPYTDFIQTYGLNHTKLSLDALKKLTIRFTSEWAVRPFLAKKTSATLAYVLQCAQDKNAHVRRWASEGSRPRLPWGERLNLFIEKPTLTFKILETLKYDTELYVRKSVANHLNDVSKDHPELVTKLLSRWRRNAPAIHHKKIDWIISHALRTLIKQGNPGALKLIGVSAKTEVKLKLFSFEKSTYSLGDKLNFSFILESSSKSSQKLVIDYVIHYMRANDKRSAKVFKLKNIEIAAQQSILIAKSHHLRKVTTRVHYSGMHLLEVQVNGVVVKSCKWNLLV
jgi:3-methyladenine DNA glycosylase AlkC